MSNAEVCNGKITSTYLGREDHGIMTFYLMVEFDGGGCSYGGYSLDGYDKDKKRRVASGSGMQAVIEVLDCIGVSNWEKLPGTYIRIEHTGWGGSITKIGNLMEDKWFSLKEFFEVAQKDDRSAE